MKKTPMFLLVLLLSTACSTLSKPYLYEAKKDDKKIIFFGTIHRGVPEWDLPDEVHDKLKSSQLAFFEVDMSDMKKYDPGKTEEEKTQFFLFIPSNEPTLDERLTVAEFNALCDSLPKWPPQTLRHVRPIAAVSLLMQQQRVMVTSYQASLLKKQNSMDLALFNEAHQNGIPTKALDQDSVLKSCISDVDAEELTMLKELLHGKSGEQIYNEFQNLVNAYRNGDDNYINSAYLSNNSPNILKERNIKWASILEKTAEKNIFVAAGLLHFLPGSNQSVLDLLRKDGYSIRKIEK